MKYKLTTNTKDFNGITLYQIQALKSFIHIKEGDLGGWIEKESNLSQEGNCWVYGNAMVYGNASVSGNAKVFENARVSENTWVSGDAIVYGNAKVYGNAWVSGNARASENAMVSGYAMVYGDAEVTKATEILNIPCLKYNLTIVPEYVFGGCRTFTHEEFSKLTLKKCQDKTWTEQELKVYKSFLKNWREMQKI